MAETIAVQRGNIATHNMHIYPGQTPTGIWASLEAQNAGIVAGNWQNHLVCTPFSEKQLIEKWGPGFGYEQVNQWRVRWPKLGSYSRLSFTSYGGPFEWDYVLRLWDAGYSSAFYVATTILEHPAGGKQYVACDWDMVGAGLSSHVNTNLFVELLVRPTDNDDANDDWAVQFEMFSMYTANRPF